MTQLTLKEIPIEDAMKSGDAVLAQWDEYDLQCEVGWMVVLWIFNQWCCADDPANSPTYNTPSRVFELPGGVI